MSKLLNSSRFNPKKFNRNQIVFYVIMIPVAIFMALPIVYLFVSAFKPSDELLEFPPKFFVRNPTFQNFVNLFMQSGTTGLPIYRYLINSIIVTVIVTFLSVLFSSTAGYILSKKRFKMKKVLFEINTLSLMFVSCAVVIPRFLIISKIGIINILKSFYL